MLSDGKSIFIGVAVQLIDKFIAVAVTFKRRSMLLDDWKMVNT